MAPQEQDPVSTPGQVPQRNFRPCWGTVSLLTQWAPRAGRGPRAEDGHHWGSWQLEVVWLPLSTPLSDASCIVPASLCHNVLSLARGHLSGGTSASCYALWQEYVGKWVFFFNGGRWSLPPTKTLSVWKSPNVEMLLIRWGGERDGQECQISIVRAKIWNWNLTWYNAGTWVWLKEQATDKCHPG